MASLMRIIQGRTEADMPAVQVFLSQERLTKFSHLNRDDLPPKKVTVPQGCVQATLAHASISFRKDDAFRMDLFTHGDAQVKGRHLRSHGYHEILEDGTFRPVDVDTFYNLNPAYRSFHCSGPGNIYIATGENYLNENSRGLVVYADPFLPNDARLALVRTSDLEKNGNGKPEVPRQNIIKRLFASALRTD